MRSLVTKGSYTFWAETTPEAYTLPCHVSMLTGVSAEKHGVTWNEYIEQSYPNVLTLFEIAKKAGYSTAMATGKMKFIVFARPVRSTVTIIRTRSPFPTAKSPCMPRHFCGNIGPA